jgi:hypothetical protein
VLHAVHAFQRAGFAVLAPEVPALVDPAQADDDLDRLVRLLGDVEARAYPELATGRVGVVGVSVGASLALHALLVHRRAGGGGARAALLIGMPYDLEALGERWFSTPRRVPGAPWDEEDARREAATFARAYLARAGLPELVPDAEDRSRLSRWLAEDPRPEEPPETDGEEARAFVRLFLAAEDGDRDAARRLLDATGVWRAWLSPKRFEESFRHLGGTVTFLLHGIGDAQVPVEHARELHRRLGRHAVCALLESRMLGHTAVDETTWGEALRHLVFLDDAFDCVGR